MSRKPVALLTPGWVIVDGLPVFHRFNVDGPVFDLVTTISKYLHLGLPLDDVLLDRKVAALLAQESQTAGLVAAVGLARFRAWVATEALAEPG